MQVSISDVKTRLSQLIKSAQAGDDVVITFRGEAVARLAPVAKPQAADIGNARHILDWLERNPLPVYARRSAEEIAADVRRERRNR
jgi:prevent-host-death family protein